MKIGDEGEDDGQYVCVAKFHESHIAYEIALLWGTLRGEAIWLINQAFGIHQQLLIRPGT